MPARMSFTLPNTQKPTSGPVGIPIPLDFRTVALITGDLALEQMQGSIEFIQSIFIDNRANLQPMEIVFSGLQYTIQVRAGRSGIWPVICAAGGLSFTAISVGAVIVPTIMFNVIQPYFTWDN